MTKKLLYGFTFLLIGLMALGVAINYIGILLGITSPLNSVVVLIVFWFTVLCVLAVNRNRVGNWIKSCHKPSVPLFVYLLALLPIMAIVGAELVNYANSNIVLMVMLVLIAGVPIICMFTKLIPEKYWAFTILMIALSIVLHRALISPYLWGSDNLKEYGVFRATNLAGVWNSNLTNLAAPAYNSTLSVSILPEMISKITFLSGFWVFKVVYPVILAVVPVGMYEILKKQFNNKISFLGTFLFVSLYTYFTSFLQLDKQLIAVLILTVFILMMFDDVQYKKKVVLLGILGVGIIVAHYSTALLFFVLIIPISVLYFKKKEIPIYLCIFWVGFYVFWYWVQGHGITLKAMFVFGGNAVSSTAAPSSVGKPVAMVIPQNEAVRIATKGSVNMPTSMLYLYLVVIGSIVLGMAVTLWRQIRNKVIDYRYLIISVIMCLILGAEVVLPRVSSVITLERMFPLALLIIAPFVFVAWEFIFRKRYVLVSVIFAAIFFLANTGFIYQIINQPLANSIALSTVPVEYPVFTTGEIQGAEWLVANAPSDKIFYDSQVLQLFTYIDVMSNNETSSAEGVLLTRGTNNMVVASVIPAGSFIFLREYNVVNNCLSLGYVTYEIMDTKFVSINGTDSFSQVIKSSKIVFDNNGCKILETTEGYKGE